MSQGDRYRLMERQVPAMTTKAYRWVGEMEEIARTFADARLTPKFHQGAAELYRLVASTSPRLRVLSRRLGFGQTHAVGHLG